MSKVTFEFNGEKEAQDIEDIVNRHKYQSACYELQKLRREIYKYWDDKKFSFKDGKLLTEEDFEKARQNNERLMGTESYIKTEDILDALDIILDEVNDLLY